MVRLLARRAARAAALAGALAASACSAPASPAGLAVPSAGRATAEPTALPSDPVTLPARYPSRPGDLPTVRLASSEPELSSAPFEIARVMNFFEYQGVKLEFVPLQSGSTALRAVQGGTIDVAIAVLSELAGGIAGGSDLQAIQNTMMMTHQFCVARDWATRKGVDRNATLAARMAAMQGARIAVTGPGAISDRATRFLLEQYGNLDPERDVTLVQAGGAAAIPGALDAKRVEGFLLAPPGCGRAASGMVLVEPGQVPEFATAIQRVVYARTSWLAGQRAAAGAIASAVSMGNNYILAHPHEALAILKHVFGRDDPAVVEDAFTSAIKPQVKPDGKMDEAMWKSTNDVLVAAGVLAEPMDVSEGGIWTNAYIGDTSVR